MEGESLLGRVTFEKKHEGSERASHSDMSGTSFPERVQQVQRPCGRSMHSMPREALVAAPVWGTVERSR